MSDDHVQSPMQPMPSKGIRITGEKSGDNFGYTVALGDVNGDLRADILIGAPTFVNNSRSMGAVYLIFGGSQLTHVTVSSSMHITTGIRYTPPGADYGFGNALDIGDIDADGLGDIAIGAPFYGSYRGMVYILYGNTSMRPISLSSLSAEQGIRITGSNTYSFFGLSLTMKFDYTGDYINNPVVSAPYLGRVYLVVSPQSNIITVDDLGMDWLTQMSPGPAIGSAVASGGDINNDGKRDLLIGVTGMSNGGWIYVILGGISWNKGYVDGDIISIYGFYIYTDSLTEIGKAISCSGDINGDGIADILIGSPSYGSNTGKVFVIFGKSGITDIYLPTLPSANGFSIAGVAANSQTGAAVAIGGNFNGDWYNDFVIAATGYASNTGAVYIVYGAINIGAVPIALSSFPSQYGIVIYGESPGCYAGYSLAMNADVNGDGFDDLLIGSPGYGSYQGRAYLIYGTATVQQVVLSDMTDQPTLQPTSRPSDHPSSQPSIQPSTQPTRRPSSQPTITPSNSPSSQPTVRPTHRPTSQPSQKPTNQPSDKPTGRPSSQPTRKPSSQPTSKPICTPSSQPSRSPTGNPTNQPTVRPSAQPSNQPSVVPSVLPTQQPAAIPSSQPSTQPSRVPTSQPSRIPTFEPTYQPTVQPSSQPSNQPTADPSSEPTNIPASQPTQQPTMKPTSPPTGLPTNQPTGVPTGFPTSHPTQLPSSLPTMLPSPCPTMCPTLQPTSVPSSLPSSQPSSQPSSVPSALPSSEPSAQPTSQPTFYPSGVPSSQPSSQPTLSPSSYPSNIPSSKPSTQPTNFPSTQPTNYPTSLPTGFPSLIPITPPTSQPSRRPSKQPSSQPSNNPSAQPNLTPTVEPSSQPISFPSTQPSSFPTHSPSGIPTNQSPLSDSSTYRPTAVPPSQPSLSPTSQPTCQPSQRPTNRPTSRPSSQASSHHQSTEPSSSLTTNPSCKPSTQPSESPSRQPSSKPTGQPSCQPSMQPTHQPTAQPSSQPSSHPSTKPSFSPSVYSRSPSFIPSPINPIGPPVPTVPVAPSPSRTPTTTPTYSPTSTISIYPSSFNSNFQISLFLFGSQSSSSSSILTDVRLTSSSLGRSYLLMGRKDGFHNVSSLSLILATNQDDSMRDISVDYEDRVMLLGQNVNNVDGGIYPTENGQTRSVTIIGDINKDGSPDLLFGDPLNSRAFVYFGNEDGANVFSNLRVSFMITINPESSTVKTGLGWAAASLGDFNRDGYDDFIVTAPTVNQAYVVYGRRTKRFLNHLTLSEMQSSSQGFRIQGNSVVDRAFGMAVSGAGDVNGDGYADILISALTASSSSQANVYVVLGNSSMPLLIDLSNPATVSQRIVKISTPKSSFSGLSITGIGDFDGDGYDDVAIGSAPYQSGQSVDQRTFIVFGRGDFLRRKRVVNVLDAEDALTIVGGGFMVTRVGDVNEDGMDDLMISSYTGWLGKSNAYCILHPRNISFPLHILNPTNFPSRSPSFLPGHSVSPTRATIPTLQTLHPSISSSSPTRKTSPHPSSCIPSPFPTVLPSRKPFVPPTVRPTIRRHPTSYPSSYPTSKIVVPIYEIYINTTGEYEPPNPSTTADDHGIQRRRINLILEVPASGSLLIGAASNRMIYTILPSPSIITITTFRNNYDLLNLTAFSSIHSLNDLQYTNLSSPLTLLLPLVTSSASTMTARSIGVQQQIIFLSCQSLDLTTDSILFAPTPNDDYQRHSRSGSGQGITFSSTYISALVALIILLLVLTIGFVWFVRKHFHELLINEKKLIHQSLVSGRKRIPNSAGKDNDVDLEARSNCSAVKNRLKYSSLISTKSDILFIVEDNGGIRSDDNDEEQVTSDYEEDYDDEDEGSFESFMFDVEEILDGFDDDPNNEDCEEYDNDDVDNVLDAEVKESVSSNSQDLYDDESEDFSLLDGEDEVVVDSENDDVDEDHEEEGEVANNHSNGSSPYSSSASSSSSCSESSGSS